LTRFSLREPVSISLENAPVAARASPGGNPMQAELAGKFAATFKRPFILSLNGPSTNVA
jgi:hypothetical protein